VGGITSSSEVIAKLCYAVNHVLLKHVFPARQSRKCHSFTHQACLYEKIFGVGKTWVKDFQDLVYSFIYLPLQVFSIYGIISFLLGLGIVTQVEESLPSKLKTQTSVLQK
jgi:hypothetical protein